MPGLMFHLLCAEYYKSDADDMFYIGNFAPDCIKERREKDISHLRDKTAPGEREAALREYAARIDLTDSFSLGTLLHLYLDFCWDAGPMEVHRQCTPPECWFESYRREVRLSSSYAYYSTPWARPLWARLLEYPPESYGIMPEYPPEKIFTLMKDNYIWHEENKIGPSEFFTPEKTDVFLKETVDSFVKWLGEIR